MKEREKELWIWGYNPIHEFVARSPESILELYCLPSFKDKDKGQKFLKLCKTKGLSVKEIDNFNRLIKTGGINHQGLCALVRNTWEVEPDVLIGELRRKDRPILLYLDQITDPQNLGAIIRSASAFGVEAIVIPERGGAPITGTAVRVSSGAIISTKVTYVKNFQGFLSFIRENLLIKLIALTPEAKKRIWEEDLGVPLVLILGSEGEGVRTNVKKHCDTLLSIPIKNINSLNVASSCSIALYEIMKQRLNKC